MTEPVWVADIFGIKFVIDTSDFSIITFDGIDLDVAGNNEKSLEVNGVVVLVTRGIIILVMLPQ